jgi:hypothetical protein
MLQYLPMITTGLQALSALSAAKNVAGGYRPTQAENAQLQAMSNRERLLKALTNPNDPILKNIEAHESTQLRNDTQSALSELLASDRRAQSMGRRSYFNPERRDESISQFLSKQAAPNMAKARSNALQRIMDAAQGYSGQATGYGNMVAGQQAAQTQDRSKQSTLFGMGADALGQGGSLSNIFAMLSQGGGQNAAMPWLSGAS